MNLTQEKTTNQMLTETKHKKLMETHNNNIIISDMNLKDKFTNFENSRLKESETLLYEINTKPKYFKRYGRGRIVKVNFGVNIGSEFSGEHFAVVVSKNDTAYNPILHVIPLTSKKHRTCIDIGNILINDEEIQRLQNLFENTQDNNKKKKIKDCLKYYCNRDNVTSYALVEHMKTISKMSIIKTINEYDYINKLKLSDEKLEEITNEILKEYTI